MNTVVITLGSAVLLLAAATQAVVLLLAAATQAAFNT